MATMTCYKFKGGCTYYWEQMKLAHTKYERLTYQKDLELAAKTLETTHKWFEDYKGEGGKKPYPFTK